MVFMKPNATQYPATDGICRASLIVMPRLAGSSGTVFRVVPVSAAFSAASFLACASGVAGKAK